MSEVRAPRLRSWNSGPGVVIRGHQLARQHVIAILLLLVALTLAAIAGVTRIGAGESAAAPAIDNVDIADAQLLYAPSNGHDGAPLVLVDGKALFPFGPGLLLNQKIDAPVMAQSVKVQEVAGASGLWIGQNADQRVYVTVPASAIEVGSIDPHALRIGEEVNLSGRIQPLPGDVGVLGLTEATGVDQVLVQGAVVEANSLSVAR